MEIEIFAGGFLLLFGLWLYSKVRNVEEKVDDLKKKDETTGIVLNAVEKQQIASNFQIQALDKAVQSVQENVAKSASIIEAMANSFEVRLEKQTHDRVVFLAEIKKETAHTVSLSIQPIERELKMLSDSLKELRHEAKK